MVERSDWALLRKRWASAPRLSEEEARNPVSSRGSAKLSDDSLSNRDIINRAVHVDMEDALETLFSRDGQFSHEIPLPQLVDILVDVWEANGNFD